MASWDHIRLGVKDLLGTDRSVQLLLLAEKQLALQVLLAQPWALLGLLAHLNTFTRITQYGNTITII